MAITLYGTDKSRTRRILWVLEELGLDYDHQPVNWNDPVLKTPRFLVLNPMGAVPILEDDGFVLTESLAIILYLCRTYGADRFWPGDPRGEAEVWRWALWVQGHLEPWIQKDERTRFLKNLAGAPLNDLVQVELAKLDRVLADREWLLGEQFGAADMAVAAVLSPSRTSVTDITGHPHVKAWNDRCYARPAAQRIRERFD